MVHPAREQEVDRAEQIDLRRRERVLPLDLGARAARRLTRAQVRDAVEPNETPRAVALEAKERPWAVVLERSRQHARATRERRRGDALVAIRAQRGAGDPHL